MNAYIRFTFSSLCSPEPQPMDDASHIQLSLKYVDNPSRAWPCLTNPGKPLWPFPEAYLLQLWGTANTNATHSHLTRLLWERFCFSLAASQILSLSWAIKHFITTCLATVLLLFVLWVHVNVSDINNAVSTQSRNLQPWHFSTVASGAFIIWFASASGGLTWPLSTPTSHLPHAASASQSLGMLGGSWPPLSVCLVSLFSCNF